jgi:PA-IL-like protein
MQQRLITAAAVAIGLALSGAVLTADTLLMRNGSRVSGRLVGVRNGVVEFEEERGSQSRTVRVNQDDVRAIEFDGGGFGQGSGFGQGGGFGNSNGDVGRPRGLRERELNVSARMPWTDTGISVRAGQMVYFDANGQVRWGSDRRDGPEGEDNSPRNPNRPIPSRPAAALIGRVGNDAPFFIGNDQNGIRMRSSGQLLLGINDDVFEDNTGAFRVTVFH